MVKLADLWGHFKAIVCVLLAIGAEIIEMHE